MADTVSESEFSLFKTLMNTNGVNVSADVLVNELKNVPAEEENKIPSTKEAEQIKEPTISPHRSREIKHSQPVLEERSLFQQTLDKFENPKKTTPTRSFVRTTEPLSSPADPLVLNNNRPLSPPRFQPQQQSAPKSQEQTYRDRPSATEQHNSYQQQQHDKNDMRTLFNNTAYVPPDFNIDIKAENNDPKTRREKQEILFQLLKTYPEESKGEQWTMRLPLFELKYELLRREQYREEQNQLQFMKEMLRIILTGAEIANKKFGPFLQLDGWANSVTRDMSRYDRAMKALYHRYFRKKQTNPIMELLWLIVGSAIMWHLSSRFLGNPSGSTSSTNNNNNNNNNNNSSNTMFNNVHDIKPPPGSSSRFPFNQPGPPQGGDGGGGGGGMGGLNLGSILKLFANQ